MTTELGQVSLDRSEQDMTAGAGELMTRALEEDRWGRNQNSTARTGKIGKDDHMTARTEQPG
jgi:hypothetical protein